MKKIIISPGCIGCGLCESIVPEVFTVDNVSHVNNCVELQKFQDKIERAVKECPVQVITYEKE